MTFGAPGQEQARVHEPRDVGKILDVFQKHGHKEVDTARFYCGGTSEEYLAHPDVDWKKRGIVMETKLYPTKVCVRPCRLERALGWEVC